MATKRKTVTKAEKAKRKMKFQQSSKQTKNVMNKMQSAYNAQMQERQDMIRRATIVDAIYEARPELSTVIDGKLQLNMDNVYLNPDDNILYSESLTSFTTTIDISSIAIDYQIIITSDFLLEEINYTDITLDSYTINTNELSNFFNVPTLNLVDTSIPLTDYNDYDDYIYSHLNNGDLIFTINCDSSISCEVLMNTPVYFDLPFNIIGFTHPYFDSKNISYSYTSEKIDIEIHAFAKKLNQLF